MACAKAYLHTKWHLDPSSRLATMDMDHFFRGEGCDFLGGVGTPSNTMWPGPRPSLVQSGIVIQSTVWPQYTNVTDRQTGQRNRQTDNGPIAYGEPFYKMSPETRAAEKKQSCHEVRGVNPEATRESMVGKVCVRGRS